LPKTGPEKLSGRAKQNTHRLIELMASFQLFCFYIVRAIARDIAIARDRE